MDELIGKFAIVHPELDNDFYRNQGKIGTISAINPHSMDATIDISGIKTDYPLETLLMLRPLHVIKKYMIRSNQYLSRQDHDNIQYIYDLVASKREKNLKEALVTGAKGFSLRNIILISLQDWVNRGLHENPLQQLSRLNRR